MFPLTWPSIFLSLKLRLNKIVKSWPRPGSEYSLLVYILPVASCGGFVGVSSAYLWQLIDTTMSIPYKHCILKDCWLQLQLLEF